MLQTASEPLQFWDFFAFGLFFLIISVIGYLSGRKERATSQEYFLAGRKLPWYVVGTSFIAANISSEHFIGMIGAAVIYGVCVSAYCWMNIGSFTFLIWLFIPFLLASRVFTTPEFLERRFNSTLRQFFAIVTIISNIVAFLAAVLYGGALALDKLFPLENITWMPTVAGFDPAQYKLLLWIGLLGIFAGFWAIYGGLSSVAWTSVPTVIVMLVGGVLVTILGLYWLSDSGSLLDGLHLMIQRNLAKDGRWAQAVAESAPHLVQGDTYHRMALLQPASHKVVPWPMLIFGVFSISIWYNVLNQFMIQRVLGAKDMYHARMGIVLAGFMQIILPIILVMPGLIMFAKHPYILTLPWKQVKPVADKTFVAMVQTLIPVGLRGLILAALFGAIQSTVNAIINSTATVFTVDIYQRMLYRKANDKHLVKVGIITSILVLIVAMILGLYIDRLGKSLFVYIQELYAFFAPPFAAIFLLGILFRRINARGATIAVFAGFALGILMKIYLIRCPDLLGPAIHSFLAPFPNQATVNWIFCVIICALVSLASPAPPPEQTTDQLVFNWRKMNIFSHLGNKWYNSVILWWALFALIIIVLLIVFSGLVF